MYKHLIFLLIDWNWFWNDVPKEKVVFVFEMGGVQK